MKTCDRFTIQFSEFVDERLSHEERAELSAHLRACPACAHEFSEFQRAHEALLLLGAPLKPRPALSAVRARIRLEEDRRRRSRWLWLPVPVAGAAIAGLLAVSLMRPGSFEPAGDVATNEGGASRPAVTVQSGTSVAALAPLVPAPSHSAPGGVAVEHRRPARSPRVILARSPAHPALVREALPPSDTAASLPAPADDAATSDESQSVMVVASRPAVSYCAVAHDPVSGAQVSEVSVRRTYAPDGSVRADIVLHFPPPKSVENNESDKSIPINRSGSRPAADPANRV